MFPPSAALGATTILLYIFLQPTYAESEICPLLGADAPTPTNLAQCFSFQEAKKGLMSEIEEAIKGGTINFNASAFSAIAWSTTDDTLFQYHFAGPHALNKTVGIEQVDENTVYRIGSVSKLFTVMTLLVEAGDMHFNLPITDYVPELKDLVYNGSVPYAGIEWEEITVGSLASQLSGIPHEYGQGEVHLSQQQALKEGYPQLNANESHLCGNMPWQTLCTREEFIHGLSNHSPVYLPFTNPIYSNVAFTILTYAIESIAGNNQQFEDVLNERLLNPLKLSGTSYTKPVDNKKGLILSDETGAQSWYEDFGYYGPSGGMYSTPRDLSTLGQAILNSKLLKPALTRRWLKPHSFTADLRSAVGAPWEIFRVSYAGRVIDLYTKSGSVAEYVSYFILAPDYDIGFTVNSAGPSVGYIAAFITESLGAALIPAAEACAKTLSGLSGTYHASGGLNTSISLTFDDKPGISISSFISNGTNFLNTIANVSGISLGQKPISRLYPTNLGNINSTSGRAFRAVSSTVPTNTTFDSPSSTGNTTNENGVTFYDTSCHAWESVDTITYGGQALDEFVISRKANGQVTVRSVGLRVDMVRE